MSDPSYDIVIVGSGNGACAFLSKYLQRSDPDTRILVVERGASLDEATRQTKAVSHRDNWTQSYSQGDVIRLHRTQTPEGVPIVSAGANVMGGGSSVNVAMIHESSEWFVKHFGRSLQYWDQIKQDLEQRLNPPNTSGNESSLAKELVTLLSESGFDLASNESRIPSYRESAESDRGSLYLFPTHFDDDGQRRFASKSLVDWDDQRIELWTRCEVKQLCLVSAPQGSRCRSLEIRDVGNKIDRWVELKEGGAVILCAGASTPRLLMPHRETLQNAKIGQHVSDHVAIPLGTFQLPQSHAVSKEALKLSSTDHYLPIFATRIPTSIGGTQSTSPYTIEFFAGSFADLVYFGSHLYSSMLAPNWLKRLLIRSPRSFQGYKQSRHLIRGLQCFRRTAWSFNLITAVVKFSPEQVGCYEENGDKITLPLLDEGIDQAVAIEAIREALPVLHSLGKETHGLLSVLEKWIGLPFDFDSVPKYVRRYSKNHLLSQQHLAGGCIMGQAADSGETRASDTGKVFGSENIFVADLSASPLPRVSPQMVAFMIGFHVANNLALRSLR